MRALLHHRTLLLAPFVLILLVESSCTVQKRVHRKGWFVQWNSKKQDRPSKTTPHQTIELNTSSLSTIEHNEVTLKEIAREVKPLDRELKEAASTRKSTPNSTSGKPVKLHKVASLVEHKSSTANHKNSRRGDQQKTFSPTRIPILAWVLLATGIALLLIGIFLAVFYFIVNMSFIGAPIYIGITILAALLMLIFATRSALAPLETQPSPPDPRYEKAEPKKEKKERKPLEKKDKIFLAVFAAFVLAIGISLLSF